VTVTVEIQKKSNSAQQAVGSRVDNIFYLFIKPLELVIFII